MRQENEELIRKDASVRKDKADCELAKADYKRMKLECERACRDAAKWQLRAESASEGMRKRDADMERMAEEIRRLQDELRRRDRHPPEATLHVPVPGDGDLAFNHALVQNREEEGTCFAPCPGVACHHYHITVARGDIRVRHFRGRAPRLPQEQPAAKRPRTNT